MWGAQWTAFLAAGGTYASRSVLAFVQSPKWMPRLDWEKSTNTAPRSVVSLPSDAVAQNSHKLSLEVAGYCVAHPAKAARGKYMTRLFKKIQNSRGRLSCVTQNSVGAPRSSCRFYDGSPAHSPLSTPFESSACKSCWT